VVRDGLEQARLGDAIRGDLRRQITLALVGRPNVRQDEREHVVDDVAPPHQAHGRDDQPLLKNLPRHRHRSRTHAPDIGVMRPIGDVKRRETDSGSRFPAGNGP
jgi:hypothetical protein